MCLVSLHAAYRQKLCMLFERFITSIEYRYVTTFIQFSMIITLQETIRRKMQSIILQMQVRNTRSNRWDQLFNFKSLTFIEVHLYFSVTWWQWSNATFSKVKRRWCWIYLLCMKTAGRCVCSIF